MVYERNKILPSVAIVIPTYNAGKDFAELLRELSYQTIQTKYQLVIDSSSTDDTKAIAQEHGWAVESISKEQFSHGGTRQDAVNILLKQNPSLDIVIFITQDVKILQIDSLENIVEVFQHKDIAAAYGRQLPHEGASVYAAVDREFNYPPESRIKSLADIEVLGIKTVFLSDSFAAYRISALKSVGGFPRIDICEDMYIAGKLLLDGYKTAYVAEATVMHSHEPVLKDIWCRYRAMGRFQKDKGIPNSEYNLGSFNPPTVHDLLAGVIKNIGSKSMLLPTNGMLVKKCLALLGNMGIELLYKEQYEIADENYLVDIEHTMNDLDWQPEFDDTDMLYQAYEYYQQEKAGKKV